MAAFRAIGLMSGTSMDGVDVALLETDGETVSAFGPSGYRAYDAGERALLRRALTDAAGLTDRNARPGGLAEAESLVTRTHAYAVEEFMSVNSIAYDSVDVIGFHGQTVLHRPDRLLTVQIGLGASLAERLEIPVVYDFRAADVAAGGQGAPLVPVFHQALVKNLDRAKPVAVLNVGGVANLTFLGDGDPLACDTGPGNALIDDVLRARTGAARDEGGALAAQGRADEAAVTRVLAHPFFARKPPKSLDRNEFSAFVTREASLDGKSVADAAATLTAITAAAVAAAIPHLPAPPRHWIVAGGGAHNATLMSMLAARLSPARVETASSVGWNPDALEAQAFAYLAVRSLRGLPISFPGTTGAPRAMTGGVLARP